MITQGKFESNHGDFTMNLRMEISKEKGLRWLQQGMSIEFQLWDWMGSRIVEPQIIQTFIHFISIGSMYGIYANIEGILMGSMLPYIAYMDPMGCEILLNQTPVYWIYSCMKMFREPFVGAPRSWMDGISSNFRNIPS